MAVGTFNTWHAHKAIIMAIMAGIDARARGDRKRAEPKNAIHRMQYTFESIEWNDPPAAAHGEVLSMYRGTRSYVRTAVLFSTANTGG